MSGRVRIGTCSSPADAALVRSVFAAHDLPAVIGAEHHASLLGPLGGSFLSLDIWVAEDDAEEAVALLRDLRERHAQTSPADEDEDDGEDDGDYSEADRGEAGGDGSSRALVAPDSPGGSVRMRLDRRRRTGVALLLGCIVTFGTAHMSTGAWMRGIALAGLEAAGIRYVAAGSPLGGIAIAAAIALDLFGALWRVRALPTSTLPVARLRSP